MIDLFENQTKLDNTPVKRLIFMALVLPAILVLTSKYRHGGKHAMGLTGYLFLVGILAVIFSFMMLYDKTVRKIVIDGDSKKLIVIIQKRFKKQLIRIQFTADNIELKEKSHTFKGKKVKTLELKKANTSFKISSEDKGISVEDVESIHKN